MALFLPPLAGQVSEVPGWWPEAVLWLGLALLVAATVAAVGAWTLVARLQALAVEAKGLGTLKEIERAIQGLLAAREELDLRRVEHLLIDLRDATRRVEQALLRAQELRPVERDALVPYAAQGPAQNLAERVVNRLLALGFERIEIVTPVEELERLTDADGHVLVESRREGMLHKGKVAIRSGRIESVHLAPAFPIFP